MFTMFAVKAAKICNYYVDWSRVGELLRSGKHHYTQDELRVRQIIIASIGISSILGAYFNDENKSGCTNTTMALLAGLTDFIVVHAIVISPLIYKRIQISRECDKLIDEIKIILNTVKLYISPEQVVKINTLVDGAIKMILTSSLSDEKHARASQTWGYRKSLLTKVKESLSGDEQTIAAFWQGNAATMLEKLKQNQEDQPVIIPKRYG